MSYLADSHRDWHYANAHRPWDCPLDCGAAEAAHEAAVRFALAPLTDEERAAEAAHEAAVRFALTPAPLADLGADPWSTPHPGYADGIPF